MSKILICISNSIIHNGEVKIVCFYEQFISSLVANGNQVTVFTPNLFNRSISRSENELREDVDEDLLVDALRKFNPDLVIAFNNATYYRLLDATDCPVVLWDADLHLLWNQCETIRKNRERYVSFSFVDKSIPLAKKNFGFSDNQCYEMRAATSLTNYHRPPSRNISFIGSYFKQYPKIFDFVKKHSDESELFEMLALIKANPFINQAELIEKTHISDNAELLADFQEIAPDLYPLVYSHSKRFDALNHIADLGLDLYGTRTWLEQPDSIDLTASYKRQLVYTTTQNEEIYNNSKICFNINHEQTVMGMPWRILDIMATGGALVSNACPYMKTLFKGKVDIPFYETPCQARQICKELLHDEPRRQAIVEASNAFIDDNCYRWPHRIREMQDILNIPLFDNPNSGNLTILQPVLKKRTLLKKSLVFVKAHKNDLRLKIYYHLKDKLTRKGLI